MIGGSRGTHKGRLRGSWWNVENAIPTSEDMEYNGLSFEGNLLSRLQIQYYHAGWISIATAIVRRAAGAWPYDHTGIRHSGRADDVIGCASTQLLEGLTAVVYPLQLFSIYL